MRAFAFALPLVGALVAGSAFAEPAYKSGQVADFFASQMLGQKRAICIGTAEECGKAAEAAEPKPFDKAELFVRLEKLVADQVHRSDGNGITGQAFVRLQNLATVGFPAQANPATIDPDVVSSLALTYVVAVVILQVATAWAFSRFPKDADRPVTVSVI